MSTEVRVPTFPESVADATVLTWHKQPGEFVARAESLVDLETDKVVLEVPAPLDGTLAEIRANEGDVVSAEDVLAIIGAADRAENTLPVANEKAVSVPDCMAIPVASKNCPAANHQKLPPIMKQQ